MMNQEKETRLSTADLAGAANTEVRQDERAVARPGPTRTQEDEGREAGRRSAADAPPLFPTAEADELWSLWDSIQTGFVDEPRQSVERADHLVAEVVKKLAEAFADERRQLEEQWSRGDEVSTEDLRVSLQRYRSFFQRLLSV